MCSSCQESQVLQRLLWCSQCVGKHRRSLSPLNCRFVYLTTYHLKRQQQTKDLPLLDGLKENSQIRRAHMLVTSAVPNTRTRTPEYVSKRFTGVPLFFILRSKTKGCGDQRSVEARDSGNQFCTWLASAHGRDVCVCVRVPVCLCKCLSQRMSSDLGLAGGVRI